MNILMLSDVYFPRVNGVSTSIQSFRDEMIRLGHRVLLVVPMYPSHNQTEEDIYRVDSRFLPMDPEDRLMNYKLFVKVVSEILSENTIDLIHIHTPFVAHYGGCKLAKQFAVPVVETYHTFFEDYFEHYLPIAPKFLLKKVARKITASQCNAVDGIVSPSGAIVTALKGYGVEKPMSVIPTGLNLDAFPETKGENFRKQHGIAEDAPLLVHVSRVAYEKNIDFILRMFAKLLSQLPDARLVITGEGPAEKSLKNLSKKLGIDQEVFFVGYLDRKNALLEGYSAADVVVFASRTETQGLVLLESMALGIPLVSTAVLGTKDVLIDGEGCLIAPEDETIFAEKVLTVLQDPLIRWRLKESGKRYVQGWKTEQMSEKMISFYRQTISLHQKNTALTDSSHQVSF